MPGPLADALAVTAAATLATAPLMALHFEQVSLASLPANLVAAPAVAPVMWLGMGSIALAQVAPALCAPLNALNGSLLAYLEWSRTSPRGRPQPRCRCGSAARPGLPRRMPRGAALAAHRPSVAARRPAAAAARAAAGGRRARGSPRSSSPRLTTAPRRRADELVVSFLDIGQGDATLLQHGGASLLVDTGPPGGPICAGFAGPGSSSLTRWCSPTRRPTTRAWRSGLRAFRPRLVLDGGAGWPTRGPARAAGDRRAHDRRARGAAAARRHPAAGAVAAAASAGLAAGGRPNDRAVVALAGAGPFDLLLTADAESDVTGPLDLPDVDALKVAHHGSATRACPRCSARARPEIAAIEVGRSNTYGHPAPSTLAALRGAVPPVVRTDRDGTVRLHVIGAAAPVERAGRGERARRCRPGRF